MTELKKDLLNLSNVLGELEGLEKEWKKASKQEKALSTNTNIDVVELLKEIGIQGIFTGKGKAQFGIYDLKVKPLTMTDNGKELDYSKTYGKLIKSFRNGGQKARDKWHNENNGEIILLAGIGGKILFFIKPNKEMVLEGKDGQPVKINSKNWDKEPLGIFSNGGRATKIAHGLAIGYKLKFDYDRRPEDKFQKDSIINPHWLTLEKDATTDRINGITRKGNKIDISKIDISKGWAPLITHLQTSI